MPEISLTTFVDFVLASGTARITCVRNAKELYGQEYDPRFDFWLPLRSAIQDLHRKNQDRTGLDRILSEVTDQKKVVAYQKCIKAYRQWMGRKRFEWTGCDSALWQFGDLSVRVNPELGLMVNQDNHVIKLYFKAEQPSKRRLDTTLHLMGTVLQAGGSQATPAILDVQRGRLFPAGNFSPNIAALLAGEAAAFSTMWTQLEARG